MLEFIRIKNFKTLLNEQFSLSQLSLFTGLNGMGKSSLIQTLLLLRQSYDKGTILNKGLLLNGDFIDLGTGKDVLSRDAENDGILFTLKHSNDDTPQHYEFTALSNQDLMPYKKGINSNINEALLQKTILFSQNFRYLCADRVSPTSLHKASEYYVNDLNSLGKNGEYAVHFIALHGKKDIPIPELKHSKSRAASLEANVNAWMSDISPNLRISATVMPQMNATQLSYSFEQGNEVTSEFKPQNVGFGLSYVLPVVTCILSAKQGDLIIIENPESHLHPAGQSSIGKLCALAAHNGVQLIIESHSDHFLNGIRVAVKEKIAEPEDVSIFFLERNAKQKTHSSDVTDLKIDLNGRIDHWPKGFFDEWDNQLDKLL